MGLMFVGTFAGAAAIMLPAVAQWREDQRGVITIERRLQAYGQLSAAIALLVTVIGIGLAG